MSCYWFGGSCAAASEPISASRAEAMIQDSRMVLNVDMGIQAFQNSVGTPAMPLFEANSGGFFVPDGWISEPFWREVVINAREGVKG